MREDMLAMKLELDVGSISVTQDDLYRWVDGDFEGLSREDARKVMHALQRLIIDLTLINRSLLGHVAPSTGSSK